MFGNSLIIARLKNQIHDNAEEQLRRLGYHAYGDLLRKLVSDCNIQEISPRRFGRMTVYTPRQLSEFLKALLELPEDLAAVIACEVLPSHAPSLGLPITIGGDFSMTLERTYLVAPGLGPKGASVLARSVILGSFLGLTWLMRRTVSNIGSTGMPGGEGDLMVQEPRMRTQVVEEIGRLSGKLRKAFR